ncbi:hypothetical protein [Gynuella sunshinyii]|uniref:Uncharacterized protein n=1 Tax=Gynuella sunshinyii YC6258 TaxID=1445510 RepID=A0A0C5VIM3_9GAMM|nr:hypothetical protein [Gynuella sunshinyii]AJQ94116.1 hypothetical Protein YC6258_02072 [Gynuella sunshinyii YC6258]
MNKYLFSIMLFASAYSHAAAALKPQMVKALANGWGGSNLYINTDLSL